MKPYILLTTSHNPSYRTRSFVKDLASSLPGILRVHRGKKSLLEIVFEARRYSIRHVIVVGERKGNPGSLKIYRIEWSNYPRGVLIHKASILFSGVKLSRDIPGYSRVFNPETVSVIIDNCISDQCFQLADVFLELFRDVLSIEKPDVRIALFDKGSFIRLEIRNRVNRICGPLLRIYRVEVV